MTLAPYDGEAWLPEIPKGLQPLSPNPGGGGDPERDLVGREAELSWLKEGVSHGGAHVTGERRMGKTWLVKKLQADLSDTVTAVYVSAENSTVALFEDRLLTALRENRLVGSKIGAWEREIGGEAKLNLGVFGLKLSAKGAKAAGVGQAGGAPGGGSGELDVLDLLGSARVVLIIDEITHLCQRLGAAVAGEFLSGLRARRESGGAPLVISGSIGLHHVLHDDSPINDLLTVEVGPLATDEAVTLAARLLLGIGVEPAPRLVASIVRQTSAIPYYIQDVVDKMAHWEEPDVGTIVEKCLTTNAWHTEHYDTRLDEYYDDKARHARAVLDFAATAGGAVSLDAVRARLLADDPGLALSRDDLLDLLVKLEKDHYLVRDGNDDRMSSPLLTRIWRYRRRLP